MALQCIVEANVPGIPAAALEREFGARGIPFHFVKYMPGEAPPRDLAGAESIGHSAHAVFFGAPPTMRHIQRSRNWTPGGWFSPDNFACSRYYSHFGRFMLNQQCVLLPVSEAVRRRRWLIETLGRDGEVFLRPDAADKGLGGCVVDAEQIAESTKRYAFNPHSLVLVASPQSVQTEWRFFIANHRIATSCQYMTDGQLNQSPRTPDEVIAFVTHVLQTVRWRPDPLFVLDVATVGGNLALLELNPFSCANPYACDVSAIVDAAIAQALAC